MRSAIEWADDDVMATPWPPLRPPRHRSLPGVRSRRRSGRRRAALTGTVVAVGHAASTSETAREVARAAWPPAARSNDSSPERAGGT
jgi:hypothetical protein